MIVYPTAQILLAAAVTYLGASSAGRALLCAGVAAPPQRHRFDCIDGLRGYLALSVMISHFVIWMQISRLGGYWIPPRINAFNNLGAGSVAIFFMITGFLFYPRILAGWSATPWRKTYIARAFRILPLTLVSILLATIIIMGRTGHSPDATYAAGLAEWLTGWREPPLLGYAESGQVNAYVLWSLWYEWGFYILVLPACALARDMMKGRLPSWVLPAALCLGALLARSARGLGEWPKYMPLFAIGMLAFECQRHAGARRFLAQPVMAVVAIACLVLGMVRQPTPTGTLQLLLFGCFFTIIACGNDLAGTLRTKGATVLGACSFGVYLVHGIVLSLLFVEGRVIIGKIDTRALPVLLPAAALLTVCFTAWLHRVVEGPALGLGQEIAFLPWVGNTTRRK